MALVNINGVKIDLNKNEAKEVERLAAYVAAEKEFAQRSADIWMRSAPSEFTQERRKAAVQALGLSAAINFA